MSFDKVNLSEVIDLALGSQNFGVVDFKLLHSLLHIIVEKLSNIFVHLKNKEIESEIANSINNKSIMNDIKNFKTFDDKVKPQNAINIAHAQMNNEATVKHIESLHDSLSTIMSNKNCTIEAMSNENSNLKIITNRVEDIEKSIKHLTLLSNDLTREFHKIQQNITSCTESKEIENLKDRLDVLLYKQYSNDIESLPSVIPKNELEYHHNHSRESNKTFEEFSDVTNNNIMENPQTDKEELLRTISTKRDTFPPTLNQSKSCTHMKTYTNATSIRESQQLAINDLWMEISDLKNFYIRSEVAQNFDMLTDRFNELENRLTDIDLKMINFENEMEILKKDSHDCKSHEVKQHNNDQCSNKIESLCNLVEKHSDDIIHLFNNREQNHQVLSCVKNQMKLLKESKVDRDDLIVILAEKADHNVVQNKVSIDQFDATKRNISQSLIDISEQITNKETEWQKSLNEMHIMVDTKLDKQEIAPFKNYMKQKVNGIQDRLKTLATLKTDAEAAGTKIEIIKNLKCISCNSEAVMKINEQFPKTQPFTPCRNLALKHISSPNRLPIKKLPTQSFCKEIPAMHSTSIKPINLFTKSNSNKTENYVFHKNDAVKLNKMCSHYIF